MRNSYPPRLGNEPRPPPPRPPLGGWSSLAFSAATKSSAISLKALTSGCSSKMGCSEMVLQENSAQNQEAQLTSTHTPDYIPYKSLARKRRHEKSQTSLPNLRPKHFGQSYIRAILGLQWAARATQSPLFEFRTSWDFGEMLLRVK